MKRFIKRFIAVVGTRGAFLFAIVIALVMGVGVPGLGADSAAIACTCCAEEGRDIQRHVFHIWHVEVYADWERAAPVRLR